MRAGTRDSFNWKKTLFFASISVITITLWVFWLASLAIATYTRESIVLSTPTNQALVISTFFMLAGLVLLSIQIVNIVEHFVGKH
ncbi:MAG: hypothetical protein U1D67_05995 [Dehalococcoidia bacterium]|nr:hypothetical protein [Dehalococcoidia bacterium]MDZ4246650.1 hypothetical protein [Dehalococcoidia bacterium]